MTGLEEGSKYTSPEIQNELLQTMVLNILQEICKAPHSFL